MLSSSVKPSWVLSSETSYRGRAVSNMLLQTVRIWYLCSPDLCVLFPRPPLGK